ncbi:hypothetical protein B7494_g4682 [Chlorociboria aeruginascens]|nr:hypothetical protein B7494_g4682 [Chlorociboria aeruginascens]
MAIFTTSNYFLSLAFVATILLWGVSVWNGTVLELILTSWNGKLEDGKSFSTNYTGIFLLDFPISLLVGFFFYGTNGSHPGYQLFLLDAYSNLQPAFIWLYLEASRQDAKPSSVANPIIWGLMWQMFGAAIALPLYFYNHLKWLKTTSQGLQTASLSSAMSLPFSFIIGVVVPTVIGELPTWVSRSDYLHQQVLAFWQPAPIWISLVQTFFVFSMGALAKDNVKSSEWVKASYLLAASLSALGHIYVVSAILRSSDPTISFTKMYTPYLVSGPEDAALRRAFTWDSSIIEPLVYSFHFPRLILQVNPNSSSTIMGSQPIQMVDVAIIGAGWYGLVAARTYLRLQPNVNLVIIDSDTSVGGVWSEDRLYPNLVAQVNLGLFNYTDTPMPAAGVTSKRQVTGRMIHNYLQKYAEDHDLLKRVRFSTFVEKAERCSRGWRLHFRDSIETIETEKLMVATGVTSIANMPEYVPVDVSIPVIHSKDLGASFDYLKDNNAIQRVIVVGAAKSAYDAVYLLISMGKKVTWIIRPDGAGPLAILPSELLGFWSSIGVASTRMMTNLSPSIFNTKGTLYNFFQKSTVGRWMTGKFWDVVAALSDSHAGYNAGDHVAALRPEVDGKSIFWANSGLGVVTLPNFWQKIHEGDVTVVRDHLNIIKGDTMVLKSGKTVQSDYIVMCTGWGDHFAMFDNETKLELGLPILGKAAQDPTPVDKLWASYDYDANLSVNAKLPFLAEGPVLKNPKTNQVPQRKWRLYRRVVPLELAEKNDRSLVILGQIHTVQTPLVSEMQSFWAILYMLGRIELPSPKEMKTEIAEWNAWTRKRYISQGQKFPYSLYDFLPYVDTLCKDLGIDSRRKSNFLSEIFAPYKPEDFNGFIDEYLQKVELDKLEVGNGDWA